VSRGESGKRAASSTFSERPRSSPVAFVGRATTEVNDADFACFNRAGGCHGRRVLASIGAMSGSGMKSGSGMSGANMFCLKRAGDASPECGFKTMAQCEQSKTSQQDMCSHQAETKGMGSGGMNKGMAK
jgi:hypothetical protein